ncbi:MAG TPA: hypothetical protein VJG48_00520 [Candidatus Paceibacterota bacterium]
MSWEYLIDPDAKKQLARFPKKDAANILFSIEQISQNPYGGDLRKLGGIAWCRRVSRYRIKFEIHKDQKLVYVYDVERRTTTTYRKR